MYKTHLNHILIPYDSNIHRKYNGLTKDEKYETFKCSKCNRIIFYYVDLENEENNIYWSFPNGEDYEDIFYGWKRLQLTCEEEQIKSLLE